MKCIKCLKDNLIICDNDCGTYYCLDCHINYYIINNDVFIGHNNKCGK